MFNYNLLETPILSAQPVAAPSLDGESIEVTFSGSGFGTSAQVYFDGVEQEILSQTDSSVVVKVTSFKNLSSGKIEFYAQNGAPKGFFEFLNPIDFSPYVSFRYIYDNAFGSASGSTINVRVNGLGLVDDEDITLNLLDGTEQICEEVSFVSFNTASCRVKAGAHSATQLLLELNGQVYPCIGDSQPGNNGCTYTTSFDPQVSLLSASATEVTLTGTDLLTNLVKAELSINDMVGSGIVTQAGSITITYDNGVPFTPDYQQGVGADLILSFRSDVSEENTQRHFATINYNFVNSLTVGFGNAIQCSYGGGCELTFGASGLTTAVEHGYAQVNVCGSPCELLDTSDASTVHCEVPAQTAVGSSLTKFGQISVVGMTEVTEIEGENFGDSAAQVANAFDGNNYTFYDSNAGTCYVGTDFGTGQKAVLESVNFFLDSFDNDRFDGHLTLEGCNDSAFTDCPFSATFATVHKGYNYLNFERAEQESFQFFRLRSDVSRGCDIGEITWKGAIAIDSGVCPVSVAFDG